MAPGRPRNRNSTWAYSASLRAASSEAPRLLPTTPAPDSAASRLCPDAVTEVNAAAGSGGRACDRATWTCAVMRSGRALASGSNTRWNSTAGSNSTLSGGATGWDWGGAPTFWNSESACGRSTTPATVSVTGGRPGRVMVIVEPGAACRFAAVCWASSTPVPAPVSVRSSRGNVAR
jgi:hypothetical protein